jgi:drug/metabolite transporter, DME family
MDDCLAPQYPKSHHLRGCLLVATAAILWSLSGLFAKSPLFDAWPTDTRGPQLAFWRALFAGLLLLPVVHRPRWRPQLVPLGLSFSLMNVTYLSAMTLTTAANAIWLQSIAPWWVLVMSIVLYGTWPTREELVPLILAAIGLAVILSHELRGQEQWGVWLGLASGATYAVVVLCLRSLRDEDSAWLVSFNLLLTAALLLPYIVWLGQWPAWWQLPVLAAFGLLQMALPYVLFARGLRLISPLEATAISLLEPLLLPLWVFAAWGEVPAWWTQLGAGLIFIGLLWRYGRPVWQAVTVRR